MYELPKSVEINGTPYKITNDGDYRMVLDIMIALNDIELGEDERILASLLIFYNDFNDTNDLPDDLSEFIMQMFNFINCGQKDTVGATSKHKLIDWEDDSQLICAAVNKVANTEVRALEYLHWWTFMGYYMSIGEGVLSTIVSIRNKIVKGKKLETYEREFRAENPQYFKWNSKSVEDRELEDYVLSLWNSEEQNNG